MPCYDVPVNMWTKEKKKNSLNIVCGFAESTLLNFCGRSQIVKPESVGEKSLNASKVCHCCEAKGHNCLFKSQA